jgi:hypothetical protein
MRNHRALRVLEDVISIGDLGRSSCAAAWPPPPETDACRGFAQVAGAEGRVRRCDYLGSHIFASAVPNVTKPNEAAHVSSASDARAETAAGAATSRLPQAVVAERGRSWRT